MTTAYDSNANHLTFMDRLNLKLDDASHPNLLLPGTRFTLFALTAIVAGAALAFVT